MEAGAQQAEMEAALPLSESAAAAETGAPKLFLIAVVSSAVAGGGCDTAGDCSCWYSNSNPLTGSLQISSPSESTHTLPDE